MDKIIFGYSRVCTANADRTVGTKIVNEPAFLDHLDGAVRGYDTTQDKIPGQHFVQLPAQAVETVSPGVGRREGRKVDDFMIREWRGRHDTYLRREFTEPVTTCAVVVYTVDAYGKDPDVDLDQESFSASSVTHVIVAVLAGSTPISPFGFLHNLSGGNREAQVLTGDEIRDEAKRVAEYWREHCTVAD